MKKTKLLTSLAALVLVLGLGACEEVEDNGAAGSTGEDTASSDTGTSNDSEGGDNEDTSDGTPSEHTHEYEITDSKEATCLEDGYTTYTCKDGDDTYTETIDALGHDWGEWEISVAGDCETDGTEVRSCSRCNATDERTVEATGHDWGDFVYDDEGHYQVCNNCGAFSEKVAHDLVYTASSRDHYHVGTCSCGYSVEDLHQAPSDTNNVCACGETLTIDSYEYVLNEDEDGYLLTGYHDWDYGIYTNNELTELYIPREHTGSEGTYPVVGIRDSDSVDKGMAADYYNLQFIGFPDTLKSIGEYGFYQLKSLKAIAFPENSQLESIGHCAFQETGLTGVNLTSDNVAIGTSAFSLVNNYGSFWLALGPYGSLGDNSSGVFEEITVTLYYRGTSDQWGTDITVGSKAFQNANNYTIHYSNEWKYVNGVPTLL